MLMALAYSCCVVCLSPLGFGVPSLDGSRVGWLPVSSRFGCASCDGGYEWSLSWVLLSFDVVVFFVLDCFYPFLRRRFSPWGSFPLGGFTPSGVPSGGIVFPFVKVAATPFYSISVEFSLFDQFFDCFLQLDAIFGVMSHAHMVFAKIVFVCPGVFSQFFGGPNSGVSELRVEAFLKYFLSRGVQRGVFGVSASRNPASSFFPGSFVFPWLGFSLLGLFP
ncbi:hypothetical protein A2U01_0016503 [Trifolium medium]|uniref:Uncharacterized protein n=1 Tax=Trifolium medium TaxID=97028 RepID=A0A392NAM8_9FABA|nr:hypothetical protein [Trifolium medium]